MKNRYKITEIREWKVRSKWFFQVHDNENKNVKRFSNSDYDLCIEERIKIKKQIDNGTYNLEYITVNKLFDLYLEHCLNRTKPISKSCEIDYQYCANIVLGSYDFRDDNKTSGDRENGIKIKGQYFRNYKINEMTTPLATELSDKLNKITHYDGSTKTPDGKIGVRNNGNSFNLMNRMFKWALGKEELNLLNNPFENVVRSDYHSIKADFKETKPDPVMVQGGFSDMLERIGKLLLAIKNYNYQHYAMTSLWSEIGNRPGEIFAATQDQYDREKGIFRITKTLNTNTGELKMTPKTRAGKRTLVLSDECRKILNIHLDELNSRDGYKEDFKWGWLLFPSQSGCTPINSRNFQNRILNRFGNQVGIDGNINPHSLRKMVITIRESIGQDTKQDVGHTTQAVNDIYNFKLPNIDKKRKEANTVASLIHQ